MKQVVCNKKDECQFKGCSHADDHDELGACPGGCENGSGGIAGATCQPVPTDLTSPLRPLKGPELYRCTKAKVCGFPDCTAIEEHTHIESIHGSRECGLLHLKVECEKVPELVVCDTADECYVQCGGHKQDHKPTYGCDARHYCSSARSMTQCNPIPSAKPLKGVYFSGKVVEVLSLLKPYDPQTGEGMKPEDWDKLWGMVTGKTERHEKALEIMADANGPESMTPTEWRESVRAIIKDIAFVSTGQVYHATARIMALPLSPRTSEK